jgi:hypothetical protein
MQDTVRSRPSAGLGSTGPPRALGRLTAWRGPKPPPDMALSGAGVRPSTACSKSPIAKTSPADAQATPPRPCASLHLRARRSLNSRGYAHSPPLEGRRRPPRRSAAAGARRSRPSSAPRRSAAAGARALGAVLGAEEPGSAGRSARACSTPTYLAATTGAKRSRACSVPRRSAVRPGRCPRAPARGGGAAASPARLSCLNGTAPPPS